MEQQLDILRHGDMLDESGISVETAKAASLYSNSEGVVFPYYDPVKKQFTGFSRTRLDSPNGHVKYIQEAGTGGRLYFPPGAHEDAESNARLLPCFVVEGEKKALALSERLSRRGVVVGLGGVWNWCKKKPFHEGPRPLIDDFAKIKLHGRKVYIIFDSDVATNTSVRQAEEELAKALTDKGANVRLVSLLPLDGDSMGLDDWLVEWKEDWAAALGVLCRRAVFSRIEIPEIVTYGEMLTRTFPPIRILLGSDGFPILNSGGLCYIHSMSGVGKTYFALQMAHCLSTGRPFLGHAGTGTPSRVVFLQAELSGGWFQRRIRSLDRTFGPTKALWVMNGQMTLARPAGYGRHEVMLLPLEQIIQNYKADVLFIDPLQGFMDIPENSTDVNREFQRQLARLRHKYECAIVVTHHDRKQQEGDAMHRMRGSSVISDWADVVFSINRTVIEKEVVPDLLTLEYDKVRHAEGPRPDAMTLKRIRADDRPTPWLTSQQG